MSLRNKGWIIIALLLTAGCFPGEDPVTPQPRVNKSAKLNSGASKQQVNFYSLTLDSLLATANPMTWDLYFDENGIQINGFRHMSVAPFDGSWSERTDTSGLEFNFLTYDHPLGFLSIADSQQYVVDMGINEIYEPLGYYKMMVINDNGLKVRFSFLEQTTFDEVEMDRKAGYYSMMYENYTDLPLQSEYDLGFGKYTDFVVFPDESAYYQVYGVLLGDAAAYELKEDFDIVDEVVRDTITFDPTKKSAIGWDWKYYSLDAGAYTVRENLTYVIRTNTGLYYKLRFTGFYDESGISGHPSFEYKLL